MGLFDTLNPLNYLTNRGDTGQTSQSYSDSYAANDAALRRIQQQAAARRTPSVTTNYPSPGPIDLSAYAVPPIVRAPRLDYAALQAKARKSAEAAVNPYYTKQLNDFLKQQSFQRLQQKIQATTNIQNVEDTLKETLKGNEITGARTAEDVAQNQADINQEADYFQSDTGTAADANRLELARTASTGGLGAQQKETAQITRNTAEKRQEEEFQKNRVQQELFKTRTFEDLARSGELAKTSREKGIKQIRFDLNDYIKNQEFETEAKREALELARLGDIGQKIGEFAKKSYSEYLAGISNPAQLAAAGQLYGGLF